MRQHEHGFSLIELLVAMAVFSFILLIIVVGFINIVQLRNQALASNMAQDNARTAMNELVRAVRDSQGVVGAPTAGPLGTICLSKVGGQSSSYKIFSSVLTRYDGCGPTATFSQSITSSSMSVVFFEAVPETMGSNIVKPQIKITVSVASNNGTATGGVCNDNNRDRNFCSTATLTSGAVPR